jgi:Na+/pantothenate symporter
MAVWQRMDSSNSFWDLVALGRIARNKGMVTCVPFSERRMVDSCVTLTTSKLRFPSLSAMSSAGVLLDRVP